MILGVFQLPFLPGFPTVCPKGVPQSSAGRAMSPRALPHPWCQGGPRGPLSPSHIQPSAEHLGLCCSPSGAFVPLSPPSLSCFYASVPQLVFLCLCPLGGFVPLSPHLSAPCCIFGGGLSPQCPWGPSGWTTLPSGIPCLLCCCSS